MGWGGGGGVYDGWTPNVQLDNYTALITLIVKIFIIQLLSVKILSTSDYMFC